MMSLVGRGLLAALPLVAAAAASAQNRAPAPAAASPSPVAGWDAFIDALRDLPGKMLAKLPPEMQTDPQVQQEVANLALQALTSSSLDALASDGDHPAFVAQIGQVLNVGQPNADTIYRTARLTPGGTYRIRGYRGTLPILKVSESGPTPAEPGWKAEKGIRPHHDFNTLKVDKNGNYDVLLSPERPAGYKGDWWQIQPTTTLLLLRMVSSDWSKERDPTFSIERVDTPAPRPRPSAAELERRLRQLPRSTDFIAMLFVDHVAKLQQAGFVNKLKVLDVSQMGGLSGQFYYEGVYDLKDDEALIVEAKAPEKCLYRSVILTNALYETTDWTNNHSSLNGTQSAIDKDGVLRVVISARDPGVPNWLDTAGNPLGLIQGRWTDCDSQPIPSVRKVALADVRAALPAETATVTPAERETIIRERRAAYQQRPLW
jgi:hypothetical protein